MTYSVPGLVRTHLVSSSYMGTVDSPFVRTRAVIDQMKGWEIMKAVTSGTEYLRENCETFLPLEPREDYSAYLVAGQPIGFYALYAAFVTGSRWVDPAKTN